MLSSMDSWLAWRTVRLGISTARPVSVLLWMPPFSFLPSVSTAGKQTDTNTFSCFFIHRKYKYCSFILQVCCVTMEASSPPCVFHVVGCVLLVLASRLPRLIVSSPPAAHHEINPCCIKGRLDLPDTAGSFSLVCGDHLTANLEFLFNAASPPARVLS